MNGRLRFICFAYFSRRKSSVMKNISLIIFFLLGSTFGWSQTSTDPFVLVLGISQDGGYPHIGCQKQCCERAWKNDSLSRNVVSLAVVDPQNKKWYLFEATPDITDQLHLF